MIAFLSMVYYSVFTVNPHFVVKATQRFIFNLNDQLNTNNVIEHITVACGQKTNVWESIYRLKVI